MTRTNAYHLLSTLLSYGLVSCNEGETKVMYSAEKPDRLIYLMKERLHEAEQKCQRAEELMPELMSVFHDPDRKLNVRYYEGVEGIITAYEDTLTAKETIRGYASVEHQHSFFLDTFQSIMKDALKRE